MYNLKFYVFDINNLYFKNNIIYFNTCIIYILLKQKLHTLITTIHIFKWFLQQLAANKYIFIIKVFFLSGQILLWGTGVISTKF